MLIILLLITAFILFVLAAIGTSSRINLMASGLACVVASMLVPLL